jgi:hypothetical protein
MITSNMNLETGIHYGVIPKNDLFNCAEEFFENAKDMSYQEALDDIKASVKEAILEQLSGDFEMEESEIEFTGLFDSIDEKFNENFSSECSLMRYEKDGFIIEASNDDCDLFIIKSPFYTLAPPCSPCAPGAGYLRDAIKEDEIDEHGEVKLGSGGIETYCLPKEWFEEGQCPYKYWKIKENV